MHFIPLLIKFSLSYMLSLCAEPLEKKKYNKTNKDVERTLVQIIDKLDIEQLE